MIHTEVWTFDRSQEKQFDTYLAEQGIERAYLEKVLKNHQTARIQWDNIIPSEISHTPSLPERMLSERYLRLFWIL